MLPVDAMLRAEIRAAILVAAAEPLATHGIVAVEVDLESGEVLAVHDITAVHDEEPPELVEEALISAIDAIGTGEEFSMSQGEILAVGTAVEDGVRVLRSVEVMKPGSLPL